MYFAAAFSKILTMLETATDGVYTRDKKNNKKYIKFKPQRLFYSKKYVASTHRHQNLRSIYVLFNKFLLWKQ
jgi:hypothetical protein